MFTFGGSGKVGKVTQKTGAEAIAAVGKTSSMELHVKLMSLTEKDDVEAYLVTFERIYMQAYEVDKTYWTYHLAPQLSGRAFAALSSKDVGDYQRRGQGSNITIVYNINTESYRRRFRDATSQSRDLNARENG